MSSGIIALPSGINSPYQYSFYDDPVWAPAGSDFKTDEPKTETQKVCTFHEWKQYNGFMEDYQYCAFCDLKRWPKRTKCD